MTIVNEIKDNSKCIARITVRARKGNSKMRIGSQTHRILGIFHRITTKVLKDQVI